MTSKIYFPQFARFVMIAVFLILFAACGDSSDSSNTSATAANEQTSDTSAAADANAAPTMPAPEGNFSAVGEQSILTDTAKLLETSAVTESTASETTVDLSVGQRAYEKNKCGDCHGAKGEGVADKGKAIAGTTLSFEDFDKVLRTGGGLGNSHIFGRSAVSPKGMEALYAYVQGLK